MKDLILVCEAWNCFLVLENPYQTFLVKDGLQFYRSSRNGLYANRPLSREGSFDDLNGLPSSAECNHHRSYQHRCEPRSPRRTEERSRNSGIMCQESGRIRTAHHITITYHKGKASLYWVTIKIERFEIGIFWIQISQHIKIRWNSCHEIHWILCRKFYLNECLRSRWNLCLKKLKFSKRSIFIATQYTCLPEVPEKLSTWRTSWSRHQSGCSAQKYM